MEDGQGSAIPGTRAGGDPPFEPSQPPPRSWFPNTVPVVRAQPLAVCRFLAAEAADGTLGPPIAAVAGANRCIAIGDVAPQSPRQQELVCLVAAHANCPRFLRGTLGVPTQPPPVREPVSRPVVAAALLLIAAIAASFGFLAVRGGLGVALVSPSPVASQLAVAATPPAATPTPTPSPTASPAASPLPSPSLAPSPSAIPSASPTPTPPAPTPRPTPQPSSDRFALLTPCPSTPNCWIYTVRPGDNLVSIANYFGVRLERIYEMNPWARTTGLRAGQELRLPRPTR